MFQCSLSSDTALWLTGDETETGRSDTLNQLESLVSIFFYFGTIPDPRKATATPQGRDVH